MKSYVLTLKFKDLLYSSQYVCVYGFGLIRMFFLVTFLLPGPGASQLWVEKSPHTDSRDLPASVFFFFFFASCGISDNSFHLPRPQFPRL